MCLGGQNTNVGNKLDKGGCRREEIKYDFKILIRVTGWLLRPFTGMRKLGVAGVDSTQVVAEHPDLELQKEA